MGDKILSRSTEGKVRKLDLTKADDCRWYISHFEFGLHRPDYVELSDGRKIDFSKMSDDEAILIANQLYEIELTADIDTAKELRRLGMLM